MKNDSCIICLDDNGDISTKHTHLGCKCKVPVHMHCWMQYVKTKNGQLECPICHVLTIRNPILPASITGLPKDIYIPRSEVVPPEEDRWMSRDRCVGKIMCCCILSWVGTISVGVLFG
jgi:hypothetical protein